MNAFGSFAEYVEERSESLAIEVVDGVISQAGIDIPEWEREKAIATFSKLWKFLGSTLEDGNDNAVPQSFIQWSKENSEIQISSGGDFSELVVRYPPTRSVFTEIITRICVKENMSVVENAHIIKRINELLDISLNEAFFAFTHLEEQRREEKEKEIVKLSTPLVPISDGIVVLPLIGSINLTITSNIMENVLDEIDQLNVTHIIADFSGALSFDAEVAKSLRRVGKALRMMGIEVVLTGLRPGSVFSIIGTGRGVSEIHSYATVKQAVESLRKNKQII